MKSRIIYFANIIRRYRHAALLAFAGRIIVFIAGGIAIGLMSAWYMIEKGSPLTTTYSGSWHLWTHDGDVGADPYTLAHMSRGGSLAHHLQQCALFHYRSATVMAKKLLLIVTIPCRENRLILTGGLWRFIRATAHPSAIKAGVLPSIAVLFCDRIMAIMKSIWPRKYDLETGLKSRATNSWC